MSDKGAPAGGCCLEMPEAIEICPPDPPVKCHDKYIYEVGTEMLDNQLVIRMEKDKSKRNKKKGAWEPPCDCDVIKIKRPTDTKGPRIVNGGDNNQILFRIHSKAHLNKKQDPNYRPQTVAYKINKAGIEEGENCRRITIHPQLGGPVSQEVYTDRVSDDNNDIYLLKIKKKNDTSETCKARNLEVELTTPKPPPVRLRKSSTPSKVTESDTTKNDPSHHNDEINKK
ncbi:PREDICTED: uncharacterized protein LOC105367892 [Ceratosolen solmsi marchali]|uniref:Uncharacterized protein LOC105367892 n=1 Tax=Ceratosolen solmsi marchali TaxID=326594 RepID=A0AAJ6YVD0_9HYME|nr:PREDICTED: uncharacterized protein LOC105367892 [Ceratosolen solmsi marchali]